PTRTQFHVKKTRSRVLPSLKLLFHSCAAFCAGRKLFRMATHHSITPLALPSHSFCKVCAILHKFAQLCILSKKPAALHPPYYLVGDPNSDGSGTRIRALVNS